MSETTALVFFDQARAMLEKAVSIDEVKQVRDQAEAMRLYAKQQKDSGEMQQYCAEIKDTSRATGWGIAQRASAQWWRQKIRVA